MSKSKKNGAVTVKPTATVKPAKAKSTAPKPSPVTYKFSGSASGKGHRTDYTLPVMVYLTKAQKESLVESAQAEGLGLSTFIRKAALAALATKD